MARSGKYLSTFDPESRKVSTCCAATTDAFEQGKCGAHEVIGAKPVEVAQALYYWYCSHGVST